MGLSELLDFDKTLLKSYTNCILIGIDEVGRGALAGPVIACAFSWRRGVYAKIRNTYFKDLLKLNDSKQLTKEEREELYKSLIKLGDYSLGYASVLEIEKVNILNATFLAMKRAYDGLINNFNNNKSTCVLIDGHKFNPFINSLQLPVIDGDAKSSLIASASIIAKVYRDSLMYKLSRLKQYKKFGWNKNVGYGTNYHMNAIRKNGATPFHRPHFLRKLRATVSV